MDTGGGGIGGRGGIDSVHTNGVSVLGRLKLQSSYTLKFLLFLILNLSWEGFFLSLKWSELYFPFCINWVSVKQDATVIKI